MPASICRTAVLMDTLISIRVVDAASADACSELVERAFGWFREVEARCSRFDEQSEVRALSTQIGTAVAVSSLLFEAVQFALNVAEASEGAFDPTIGHTQERRGFNRNYQTGRRSVATIEPSAPCSFRDVQLDPLQRTINLLQPLILDLGAVAKGLAVDLAAQELQACANFAIDAGGDIFARGQNQIGRSWTVGIRNPRQPEELIETLQLSGGAICTSGDYERKSAEGSEEHHILDPRTGHSPTEAASVTVVAPTAMLADALATAAFVLGPKRGLSLLSRQGVEGLILDRRLRQYATPGLARYR